jgi:hypothetical protein
MPKKISKSVIQSVKQSVNINMMPASKRARRSRAKSIPVQRLNTGSQLSAVVVPSGSFSQQGSSTREQIPQAFHRIGRIERTIDDLLSNVSTSKAIQADPKPILRPIDQPMAYDTGFINLSESPMPFIDNSLRRSPVKMEDIPIPQQGMFIDDARREMYSIDNQLANRLMDIKSTSESDRKIELRKRIDKSYADTLRQQRDIQQQQMSPYPPSSPYEVAESKVEYK